MQSTSKRASTDNTDSNDYSLSRAANMVVQATMRGSKQPVELHLFIKEQIGRGSFGRVYKAHLMDATRKMIAIKQVELNVRVQQREMPILEQLDHCNIVRFLFHFQISMLSPDNRHLKHFNMLAFEYMPMTLMTYLHQHYNHKICVPLLYTRLLTYQIFRALAYLKSQSICHRDIKPENTLINPVKYTIKLADFGSAKQITPEHPEKSLSYMCSRLYRAPELFAHCDTYGTEVDMWSAGCILAELIKGKPLFDDKQPKTSQLLYIIQVLGTGGLEQVPSVHAIYLASGVEAPAPPRNWSTLLGRSLPADLVSLLEQCLQFEAAKRILPLNACAHDAYNELRTMKTHKVCLPNGEPLPPLFNFSPQEVTIDHPLWIKLVPLPTVKRSED